ncbi:MAG: hypothetical protein QNK23_13805 [Crocinitomicaceae bacterium]|nr:hypothetical protein [Crocinitomicaceae bacterium]
MITLEGIVGKEYSTYEYQVIVRDLLDKGYFTNIIKSIQLVNKKVNKVNTGKLHFAKLKMESVISSLLIKSCQVLESSERDMPNYSRVFTILKKLYIECVFSFPLKQRTRLLLETQVLINETAFIFDFQYRFYACFDKLNKSLIRRESNKTSIESPNNLPKLEWSLKNKESFSGYLELFSKLNIGDASQFKLLFENPKAPLDIQLDETNPEFVMQFFCCLKESGFISVKNTRGFYQVLRTHIKNFDSVFLNNRSPQRRIDTVKNLVSWPTNKDRIDASLRLLIK